MGWDATLVDAVVTPPPLVRAALVAVAVLFAAWALRRGILRISEGRDPEGGGPAALIRGVRFVFLAVAGLSAAAGWLLGHPLPLIVALVIGAVDVIETTFLLLVLGARPGGGPEWRHGDARRGPLARPANDAAVRRPRSTPAVPRSPDGWCDPAPSGHRGERRPGATIARDGQPGVGSERTCARASRRGATARRWPAQPASA